MHFPPLPDPHADPLRLLPLYPATDADPGYGRGRDLPLEQRAPFLRWLFNHVRPYLPGVPDEAQDAFWPWDYARWRVEELCHDPAQVKVGEVWTGHLITVRDLALALPEENLATFAREHAARTGCANLIDVLSPTPEQLALSAACYLDEFQRWRRRADRGEENDPDPG